jgi:hypothetical protein
MRDGKVRCYVNSDLIFLARVPTVVLVWEQDPHGDCPAVTVTLDPAYLHKINWPEAEYLYELSVEDRRGEFGSDMGSKTPQMTEQSPEPKPNDVRQVSFKRKRQLSLSGVSELALGGRNESVGVSTWTAAAARRQAL